MIWGEQKLVLWIVGAVSLQGKVAMLDGVAVDAAVRAGVVCADVARGEAGALFAITAQLDVFDD